MISGFDFYKMCKWNVCNRYPINFKIDSINDYDFIFVNLDTIYNFINYLDSHNFNKKIVLITHNSDISFNQNILNRLKKYTTRIYPINSIVNDKIVTKIPLGFSDRLVPVIQNIITTGNKDNLIYLNFNQTRNDERKECLDFFKSFSWVTYENEIPEKDYYISLSVSKYSLCPSGTGLDTHRFYESIYFDTIPIVKRNDISDIHSKFPCIIIEDWSEINNNFLIDNYDTNLNRLLDWKKNNDWLNPIFWLK